MRRVLHSPSMLVALVALVLALAGTGYAAGLAKNSVGTPQLKSGAVTTVKLAPAASARVAGLTYRGEPIAMDPKSAGAMTVSCPAGLTAIAGGAETPHVLGIYLLDSHPTNGTGWQVGLENDNDVAQQVTAWAVCAKVAGGKPQAAMSAGRATMHRFGPSR